MSPSALPEGEPAPVDGTLPASVGIGAAERQWGLYVHIPFCAVRCGYCDFNTYTASELGQGASQAEYAQSAMAEMRFAAHVIEQAELPPRPLNTVFFGGGTPTLLPSGDLAALLNTAQDLWGLAPGAEVTFEANPDSVTPESLAELAHAGFTRISVGMQSVVPEVLATLDRTHNPDRVPQAVSWAREAGLAVSVDLIYGTPGETVEQWQQSVDAALSYQPDHISAYALIVEPGTRLATQIRRGDVENIDDDEQAEKYLIADENFRKAGFDWYEVSNWARSPAAACQHNLSYWQGDDWWGIGPGAHSHCGGVRWWNVKHPRNYAARLQEGQSPAAAREVLAENTRLLERIMLELRLAQGLDIAVVEEFARLQRTEAPVSGVVASLMARSLVEPTAVFAGKLILTQQGRLLADAVVRELLA